MRILLLLTYDSMSMRDWSLSGDRDKRSGEPFLTGDPRLLERAPV